MTCLENQTASCPHASNKYIATSRTILIATFAWLLISGIPARAATFYVANAGNDSNSGTCNERPWKSLARVNSGWFQPGDSILLKRGDVWREQLLPPSSGHSADRIIISAYGDGPDPIVSGADLVTNWTKAGPSIWSAALTVQPNVLFIGGALAIEKLSVSQLSGPAQWTWSQGTLSVYQASGSPTQVEAAQRDYALLLGQTGGGSFTTVHGINFRIANQDVVHIVNTSGDAISDNSITGAYQFGLFAIGVSGSTVNQLHVVKNIVSLNGSSGIEISSGHDHVTVEDNNVFLNAYNPSNSGNFQFMAGIYLFSNSGKPTYDLVQKNVSSNNGVAGGNESQGSGIWLDTTANSTVQNNYAYGNRAHGIFLEKNTHSLMANNVAYANGFAPNSANLTCYASFGVAATGNTVTNNASAGSNGIGMKLGAYQGGGSTLFSDNLIENNTVSNSQATDVVIDSGADNNGLNGKGNIYKDNSFIGPK